MKHYIVSLFDKDGNEYKTNPVTFGKEQIILAVDNTLKTTNKYVRYEIKEVELKL